MGDGRQVLTPGQASGRVAGERPGGPSVNAAVRLGLGAAWTSSVVGATCARLTYLVAGNGAFASAVWPVGIGVKYHVALKQSDYR